MERRYHNELKLLGKKIKYFREKKGWVQLDLELRSDINRTEISKIENGKKNIEFYTIVRLADALEIELIDLFRK